MSRHGQTSAGVRHGSRVKDPVRWRRAIRHRVWILAPRSGASRRGARSSAATCEGAGGSRGHGDGVARVGRDPEAGCGAEVPAGGGDDGPGLRWPTSTTRPAAAPSSRTPASCASPISCRPTVLRRASLSPSIVSSPCGPPRQCAPHRYRRLRTDYHRACGKGITFRAGRRSPERGCL